MCDRKFFIRDLLQEKHLQIEAQTQQLLGKQGMSKQVEQAEEKLEKLKHEKNRSLKIYSADINKLSLLIDKIEFKKQSILKRQDTLQD